MNKLVKLILLAMLVGSFIGIIFINYKVNLEEKVNQYIEDKNKIEFQALNILLGEKEEEYKELLRNYYKALDEKDIKKLNEIKEQLSQLIYNLEMNNINEVDKKIAELNNLDLSSANRDIQRQVKNKLQVISFYKEDLKFKEAYEELEKVFQMLASNLK